jgi:hypothetical protein
MIAEGVEVDSENEKSHSEEWLNSLFLLVPMIGIELTTFALRMPM